MPELPEVEHGARILRTATVDHTIASVRVGHRVFERMLSRDTLARLAGRRVTAVARRGKHQLATLDDGSVLDFHFGMTGEWVIGRTDDAPDRFPRLVIDLTDGTRVTLSDSRVLGAARLHPPGALALEALGPEPLEDGFTAEGLGGALRTRRGPIKAALLDQRVVAGLGNIYAAEALWLARINPKARASSLGLERRERLVRAIQTVLRRAPVARYTEWTDRATQWRVYDREGQRCRRCGKRIARITQAGRSTYYCRGCQT